MRAGISWPRLWRLFLTAPLWQALAIGLLASLLARGLWALAPTTFTELDSTLYDTWLRVRPPIPTSAAFPIVVRDPRREDRFGPIFDRPLFAQLIMAAHEAGPGAIGINH